MPGVLLNNTLSHLSSGVTQQYQEGRFDSQVTEMINCNPTITRGVMRRNPLNFTATLTGTNLPADTSDSFVYTYDRGTGTEQYMVVVPGNGYLLVYNMNTGALINELNGGTYFQAPVGTIAKDIFRAFTIGDYTFIVNTTVKPSFTSSLTSTTGYSDMAFYWIKKTVSIVVEQKQSANTTLEPVVTYSGSLIQGYTYTCNGISITGTKDTRPGVTAINKSTAYEIAEEFFNQSATSKMTAHDGPYAYNTAYSETALNWEDSFGSEASLGVYKTIDDASRLPAELPSALDGFITQVTGNTDDDFDDFYLKYSHADKSWIEIPKPGVKYVLDGATMPNVLYRLADGSFTVNTYQTVSEDGLTLTGTSAWGERVSGGDNVENTPSFIGKNLENIFFHKNRLGFITKDSIVLSQTGAYGDFFVQTAQDLRDDDPIDLAVASTDVTILRHAVPTAGQLFLFSDDTQFILDSLDGPLTPKSADIIALSSYTYGPDAEATSIGNKVYFTNQAGGYSQLYSYRVTDQGSRLTEADQMTLHTPTYLDNSINKIIGHDVLGLTFMQSVTNASEVYILTSVQKSNKDLQNAFHKWTFAKDVSDISIINNRLYILFSDKTVVYMELEIPGDIASVSYLDEYASDVYSSYTSSIEFSEFFVRDSNGKGTTRGRYQIRTMEYTIEDGSYYKTEVKSLNQGLLDTTVYYGPTWDDTAVWNDSLIWSDVDFVYTRTYYNDKKVTVSSNSKTAQITFSNNENEPSKGFELATINVEGFFYQRSQRK